MARKKPTAVNTRQIGAGMRELVAERVKYWSKRMGVQEYTIAVEFKTELATNIAEINVDTAYLRAKIGFNMGELLTTMDSDELDRVIVHELSHILLGEIQAALEEFGKQGKANTVLVHEIIERTTTRLERAFIGVARDAQTESVGGVLTIEQD